MAKEINASSLRLFKRDALSNIDAMTSKEVSSNPKNFISYDKSLVATLAQEERIKSTDKLYNKICYHSEDRSMVIFGISRQLYNCTL